MLQTALNHIAPRFPTIVAGIRRGTYAYAKEKVPYNCGAAPYRGKLYFHFSRRCENAELERRFFCRLASMSCGSEFEVNGRPVGQGSHLESFGSWSGPPDKERALCGAV